MSINEINITTEDNTLLHTYSKMHSGEAKKTGNY